MSEAETPDPSTYAPAVDAMLAAAGIAPTEAERGQLVEMYAFYRPAIAAMHALAEARYEAPALVFQAQPKLAKWGR